MPAAGEKVIADHVEDLEQYTIDKPLCRLIAQSAQSLTDNTGTAITFGSGSEDIDTHGFHDTSTNTSRITPSVEGYYRVTALFWLASNTTCTDMYVAIYKTGAIHTINRAKPDGTASDAPSAQVTAIVSANGSTDYFEMFCLQDDSGGSARNTATGSGTACVLEAEFLRPL